MTTINISDGLKENWKNVFDKIKNNREEYLEWIKNEISELIIYINKFDKVSVLGGVGARLIKSSPTIYTEFLEGYEGEGKAELLGDLLQPDDHIEVLLEYALSIATATENSSSEIPNAEDLDNIYHKLLKVKVNLNILEVSADIPSGGNEYDHWLRTTVMLDTMNVRGDGYHKHIEELYKEIFSLHDQFLVDKFGFSSVDLYKLVLKLDTLVYSKVGNIFGGFKCHDRFVEWSNEIGEQMVTLIMKETGKHFMTQFLEANPDLYHPENPEKWTSYPLESIANYPTIFWVNPNNSKEKKIMENISLSFGDNKAFFEPEKFKAFILNDTKIKKWPLVKYQNKYFHFSLNLAFRNLFRITENLIESADKSYYTDSFRGNTNINSKDNYIERKSILLFKKILPNTNFYHSLEYSFKDEKGERKTELDILGVSDQNLYIIEVKAGELNDKHKRGALKGLKDRINETINEGSYQCHRALNYINEKDEVSFTYSEGNTTKELKIKKSNYKKIYKISVTFEHYSAISTNLKYLINANILSPDYKWTWIVSIYDLMIFADLINCEEEFLSYLENRLKIYERDDVEFNDEIDILGFFKKGKFPLPEPKSGTVLKIIDFKKDIDERYKHLYIPPKPSFLHKKNR